MNLENPENVKCGRCKCYRSEESFFNNKGRRLKSCKNCRDIDARSREKCKCEHGRQKSRCKECGGASICNHNRIRNQCKECSDPIKLTIKNMICGAKANDKKYNRYDAVNFVDYCFVENLLDDYKCCYYEDCKKELQIMKYNNSLATLERINNNIGHIKSNCVICCLECNRKVKSNETTC